MTQHTNTQQRLNGAVVNGSDQVVSSRRRGSSGSPRNRKWQAEALSAYLGPAFLLLSRPASGDTSTLPKRLGKLAVEQPDEWKQLYDLYSTSSYQPPIRPRPPVGRRHRARRWITEHVWNAPPVVFLVITGLATAAYVLFRMRPEWQVPVALGFIVLLFALLPGFLYLRFIRFRIGPLSDEYVYNLHRLRVDEPCFLPEPARTSAAWAEWNAKGGPGYRTCPPNIYARKFESQYGRWPMSGQDEHQDDLGRLMSVYLCLASLLVGWAFVVWTATIADTLPRLADALRFGFLGAYFFLLSMLIRRYFQNDLRPGAYLGGVVRIVTVLVLVVGVDQVFSISDVPTDRPYPVENAVAFLVGVFPTVGLQLIRRAVAKVTGPFRGGLEPPFPLSQLDGMDIWSEARLAEVGIEDVQHLATANLIDVILGARIPTERIVDWVDQGLLLLHTGLPRSDNAHAHTTYAYLRVLGVRTSTDLLTLVQRLGLDLQPGQPWPADDPRVAPLSALPVPPDTEESPTLAWMATVPVLTRLALAEATLQHQPNLRLVRNWYGTDPEGPADDEDELAGGWGA
jgi:hypothetical protein